MTPKEFKRLYRIITILLEQGIDELVPARYQPWPGRLARRSLFWLKNKQPDLSRGARIRLAFEALGPIFIKFGQMLSTRRDLLPPDIAEELALLQDRVPPFCGQAARQQIELSLGCPIETLFDDFDETPLASASIAQVHTARLKESGREIVIKVIRPDIEPVIEADLRLMQALARLVARFVPQSARLRPIEVVEEYRKTILDELNLMREAANAIQLRRNFTGSEALYVPEIITDLCREQVLVMERIYGIPVSDIPALEANGTNMKLLAERGVEVFFTQVFRDSFFHADMHPGNIFVSYEHPENPLWIGIDCGIVGTLNREDKRYLAENFLAFFNRDYRQGGGAARGVGLGTGRHQGGRVRVCHSHRAGAHLREAALRNFVRSRAAQPVQHRASLPYDGAAAAGAAAKDPALCGRVGASALPAARFVADRQAVPRELDARTGRAQVGIERHQGEGAILGGEAAGAAGAGL